MVLITHKLQLKEGLKTAMLILGEGNKYLQIVVTTLVLVPELANGASGSETRVYIRKKMLKQEALEPVVKDSDKGVVNTQNVKIVKSKKEKFEKKRKVVTKEKMRSNHAYEASGRAYILFGLSSQSWQREKTRGNSICSRATCQGTSREAGTCDV